ncbi:MAG: response regulator [Planctomycetaceae bacterium]
MFDKTRILIVDDDADILRGTILRMSVAGYQVMSAQNGMEAVEMATEYLPDVIIMDVRMPELDGLSAMKILQNQKQTQDIPVIILSASLMDREHALDVGAAYFLTKPFQGDALIETVRVAIRQKQSRQVSHSPVPQFQT